MKERAAMNLNVVLMLLGDLRSW